MRVLLVNPTQQNVYGKGVAPPYPPLGLLYVASSLEHSGCQVQVLDWDADIASPTVLYRFLADYRPELVGITSTTPQIGSALALASMVKEMSGAWVVLGGAHPSALPGEVLSHQPVDFVVVGEGEQTASELVRGLQRGDLEEIDGLWYKEGGEVRANPPRSLRRDLDGLAFPAHHLLKSRRKYSPPEALSSRWVSLITSRGCPHGCSFCATPGLLGKTVRRRTVEDVLTEIEEEIERFGVHEVHIADDCFTSDRKWVLALCRALKDLSKELSLYLMNGLRADQVDHELLSSLKEVGLKNVGFGVESGSEQILRRCRKGLSLEKVRESFALSKSLGLSTWGFFILGLPGETQQTAQQTIDFALSVDPDYAKFFFLVPYPGTEVWDELSEGGLITDREFSHYGLYSRPVFRLPTMNEQEMERLLYRAYREFYLRPKKIARHLLSVRSLTGMRLKLRGALFLRRFLATPC